MRSTFQSVNLRRANRFPVVLCLLAGLAVALPAFGQMSPEEHASHHPDQAGGASPAAGATPSAGTGSAQAATSESTGGTGGMMGGGMGDMMKDMGAPPPRELYPTLMNMPEVTSAERTEILSQADERMASAVGLLSEGLQRLAKAAENDNYAAMQDASAKMHEALARLDSGVAAQRALAEGQPPDKVALQWFKNEMNLHTPPVVESRGGLLGATPFHLFSMVLLVVFTLVMVALYFVKMRARRPSLGELRRARAHHLPDRRARLAGASPANDAEGASA